MPKMEVDIGENLAIGENKFSTDGPVTIGFQDSRGDDYTLVLKDNDESLDIILTYPDGNSIGLESIVQSDN
jgi:hypothetical protein